MPLVTSGVEKGNLRELALARMAALGLRCRDVRTREVGIQDIHHKVRGGGVVGGLGFRWAGGGGVGFWWAGLELPFFGGGGGSIRTQV